MTTQAKLFVDWKNQVDGLIKTLEKDKTLPVQTNNAILKDNKMSVSDTAQTVFVNALSYIPYAGGILSTFAGLLFSYNSNNQLKYDLWNEFTPLIQEMISSAFTKDKLASLKNKIESINNTYQDFLDSKDTFNKNKTTENKNKIFLDFDQLLLNIEQAIIDAKQEEYEHQLIGVFAIVSTYHVLILREGIINGGTWVGDSKIKYETKLKKVKILYLRHAKKAFEIGCNKIRNTPINNKMDSIKNFNLLMAYRSYCSRFVFDYMDNWYVLDEKSFPNGSFVENVRYCWCEVIGTPTNPGSNIDKDIASLQTLEKKFEEGNYDFYSKEFRGVEIENDGNYFYNIRSLFNVVDTSVTTNVDYEKGVMYGNTSFSSLGFNKALKQTYVYRCPSTFNASSVIGVAHKYFLPVPTNVKTFSIRPILPRGIKFSEKDIFQPPKEKIDALLSTDINVQFQVSNHKVGKVCGFGFSPITIYEGNKILVLDSLFVGFSPVGVYDDNFIFGKEATLINAQKMSNSLNDKVKFQRDHVLPNVHSIFLSANSSIKFAYKLYPGNKTTTYSVGVRYHFSGGLPVANISFTNHDGKTIFGSGTLEKCLKSTDIDPDTKNENGINEYKIKRFDNIKINLSTLKNKFVSLLTKNNVSIHSIIFYPVVTAA